MLYLIKDFITPFFPAELGVMRSWFFCTVCKNILKGRPTYKRNAKNNPQEREQETGLSEVHQGCKDLTLLAGKAEDGIFLFGGESPPSSAC